MDQEQPTAPTGDASPLDRLEAMLSADDAPQEATPDEGKPADVPATDPEKTDEPGEQEETPEYQLTDVAAMLGADASMLDVDDDGAIMVKTKIDGVEGKAKFSDLIKSYQLQGHVDKQVREAAEIRKSAQEQAAMVQQQIQVQQAVIGQLAEVKAIEAEYQQYRGINLDALIDSDPVQALKVQRHMQALQERHAQASERVQQAASHIQQQQQQASEATLENERQALAKAVPEWSSEAVATKEKQAIAADLRSRGYSERDIQGLSDHKAVLLALDAMRYRAMKATNTATEKQVRAAPKIIKPGSTQSAGRNMNAVQKAKQEVRSTGSRESIANYLLATGRA